MPRIERISYDIVEIAIKELQSRAGFDDWWDQLDVDIKQSIKDCIADQVYGKLIDEEI